MTRGGRRHTIGDIRWKMTPCRLRRCTGGSYTGTYPDCSEGAAGPECAAPLYGTLGGRGEDPRRQADLRFIPASAGRHRVPADFSSSARIGLMVASVKGPR